MSPLDEDSPTAGPPPGFGVALKLHQSAALHRCRELEASLGQGVAVGTAMMHTRAGILADTVGSGKSLVILALAWDGAGGGDAVPHPPPVESAAYGCNKVHVDTLELGIRIRTTVVVVPHALCSQWRSYLVDAGYAVPAPGKAQPIGVGRGRCAVVVGTARSVEALFPTAIEAIEVVVVSATTYPSLSAALTLHGLRVARLVFDEADTLALPTVPPPAAGFCWYVTASYANLLFPLGSAAYYRSTIEGMVESPFCRGPAGAAEGHTGLRPATGHTRVLFKDLYETAPPAVVRALVVMCDDAFVARSLNLPPLVLTIVRCRTPNAIALLEGLTDRSVLEALEAGDEAGALRLVASTGRVVGADESIMTLTMERLARQLNNAQCQLDMAGPEDDARRVLFESDQERDAAVAVLQRKRDELQGRMASVCARVRDTHTCLICVDVIRHKTVTPCCANAYCLRCIHTWLVRRRMCPICRRPLLVEDLVTVTADEGPVARVPGAGRTVHGNKGAALEAVLRRCGVHGAAPPSVLVFSGYDDLLSDAGQALTRAGMRHAPLKGNGATINAVVADYRSGELTALLANVRSYGSGLNLEHTTDVVLMHRLDPELERQVVGRAQRPGRTTPLHVWQLLHEDQT